MESYQGLAKTLKGRLPPAKKLRTDAHALGDRFTGHVGKRTAQAPQAAERCVKHDGGGRSALKNKFLN